MASKRNDALLERTVEGPVNYYDNHRSKGTATDKGLASRLGGHDYNILTNQAKDEIYFRELRNDDHPIDLKGRHTRHFLGPRRRKYEGDERNLAAQGLRMPDAHPRDEARNQRRTELQLAQMENFSNYGGFQSRCQDQFFPPHTKEAKPYTISNNSYAYEADKVYGTRTATKSDWRSRRGESLSRSISAPSVSMRDPAGSLSQTVREDARKQAHQRMTESAHFAHGMSANTYTCSLDATNQGRDHDNSHKHCSVNRLENHDFAVSRKNNHFSSHDKLTRSDPYFMRPRFGVTHNSVKYDIVNNERRWFKYGSVAH